MKRMLAVVLSAVAGTACVVVPTPVPATPTGSDPNLTFVESAGVRIWAGGRWDGVPARLGEVITPVKVVIENRSGHPLRISYRDCALVGGTGFRYAALPPFAVRPIGQVDVPRSVVLADYHPAAPATPPVKLRYPHRRFHVAPPYVHVYPGLLVWAHLWAWDAAQHRLWATWPVELPTADMQERALPEGVLQNEGSITGFLYFQRASREGAVSLEVTLVDAETGATFGTAALPFTVTF